MKNKVLNYVLIAGAIVLWVIIIKRIFDASRAPEEGATPLIASKPHIDYYKAIETDTESLKLNYKDPFLKGESMASNSAIKKDSAKASERKTTVATAPPVDLSFIKFEGIIFNKANRKKIAIISIHDKEYMTQTGKKIDGVAIREISPKNIQIKYHDKTYSIQRTQ